MQTTVMSGLQALERGEAGLALGRAGPRGRTVPAQFAACLTALTP